jgi:PAS domain S-box-containing protein
MSEFRESEERFRLMADGVPLMIWVHDAQGQQQFVNHTFCELFGVSAMEMTGERWRSLMHPEDAEAYASKFATCVEERRPFEGETRVRRSLGLATISQRMELVGGSAEVNAVPGQGVRIRLRVPALSLESLSHPPAADLAASI